VKKCIARDQIFFDFWCHFDDNKWTFVQQKTPCRCGYSGMGAGHPGGSRPNGVKATSILPDPPQPGKGSIMSGSTAIVLVSSITAFPLPSPVTLKINDPDETRRQRGRAIAGISRIVEKRPGLWTVPSQTGSGQHWVKMDQAQPSCTCKDFATRERACKHVYAVRAFIEERDASAAGAEPVSLPIAERAPEPHVIRKKTTAPRSTYRQDWPNYNASQINEKAKFLMLLTELCQGIPEPPSNPKGGRPPLPMADRAFACALKVYTTISGRRASTDMQDATDKGHLSRAPHYSAVFRYLEDPVMTPILMSLIAESARPLRTIESDFAVDSSGFTSSRFVRWFDHKYGVVKSEYDWVKVSICTGKTTNVVTAVEVDERYAADCPKFAPLLKATAKNFKIREASADSAYLSYENCELVASLGGTPYIAFKSNTTADGGGTLARMYHLFQFNRDEYLKHYHKRSNVETTFSMVKGKFGDHVRSKTDRAMVNEVLCKILCHNLCCIIQSTYELGVETKFWGKEDVAPKTEAVEVEADPVEALAWF
jgi:transposase